MNIKNIRDKNKRLLLLQKPLITEKATSLAMQERPVYVFEVPAASNKVMIREAFEERFNKKPLKINIINLPTKRVSVRGRLGFRSGKKKALIYLAAGETIDLI